MNSSTRRYNSDAVENVVVCGKSGQRCQRCDEGVGSLEALDKFFIGRDELASLLLGQTDIQAIVDADALFRRNVAGVHKKRIRRMKLRRRGEDICEEYQ